MSRLRTVRPCPDIAGLRIFALRGIVVEVDRESLLSGLHAIVQEGRRNINGSKADIAIISVNSNVKGDCFSEGDQIYRDSLSERFEIGSHSKFKHN